MCFYNVHLLCLTRHSAERHTDIVGDFRGDVTSVPNNHHDWKRLEKSTLTIVTVCRLCENTHARTLIWDFFFLPIICTKKAPSVLQVFFPHNIIVLFNVYYKNKTPWVHLNHKLCCLRCRSTQRIVDNTFSTWSQRRWTLSLQQWISHSSVLENHKKIAEPQIETQYTDGCVIHGCYCTCHC